ncbi:50S ribosomal protein L10 [Halobacteriales archaeon QS_8_65_32]|nr:MAG: 50S ribosomal protein L10 [Halobacteriales archaeon QS_8_65_32]
MAAGADAESETEAGEAGADRGAADHRTAEIPTWKREEIDDLARIIESYDSVGVVSVAGIPSRQLQAMRADLHGRAVLRVARNTLLVRALDAAEERRGDGNTESDAGENGDGSSIGTLTNEVSGQVGLIATDDNPFGLFKQLEASKTPAPINAGETAPNDITIPASDTGIDPGPFVGDLQQVGASARIMEGSIRVTEDSTVLEEGEDVSRQLADVLRELAIEPKEVGLDLRAVYSEGTIFEPDELALDVEEYRTNFEAGAARARALSIGAVYPTTRTAPALLGKGHGEARSLGLAAAIESPDLVDDLLSQANADLRALAAAIDDEEALPEELRGVDAPPEPADDEDADGEAADDADADADSEAEDASDETNDDDDGGGEGLGAMFG